MLKTWLLSFLVWGVVALAFGGFLVAQLGFPWSSGLNMALREWLPWAILTPLLFRFVARFPISRESWKTALPAQLACCIATVALCEWWGATMGLGREFRMPMPPFMAQIAGSSGQMPMPPWGWRGPGSMVFFRIMAVRLPVYLTVVSLGHAFTFYGRSQERERRSLGLAASLAKARLEALKMQLQPHFLFNSLNAIAELVHRDPAAAEEMLIALSDLLRLTLSTSGEQELPLARELELVERYLAIEHVRYGDRLRFERDVAPGTEAALVPTFLLQPLVENAVRHGLEPRGEAGNLRISTRREGEQLRLTVADNGVGLPGGRVPREGVGLSNTRARLRELYGDAGTFELRSDRGVTVEIAIPFRIV
jgi:two-component system LytT family sensor kinase